MKELFLNYKLSLLAKEKGFDEPCFAGYNDGGVLLFYHPNDDAYTSTDIEEYDFKGLMDWENISAPLYQQIIDFFREKHNIHIVIDDGPEDLGYSYIIYYYMSRGQRVKEGFGHNEENKIEYTYYQALDKAIEEAFKLI